MESAPSVARRARPVLVALLLSVGCGPAIPADSPAALDLPVWEGPVTALFDDAVDPAAIGLAETRDERLRDRARTAELVARIRIQTFTVETEGGETRYRFGVQVASPTLAPTQIKETSFDLVVAKGSQAFGIAKQLDATLRDKTFIGFFHRFRKGAEVEMHFHFAPDTEAVATEVREAVALKEVSGS